MKHVPLTTRTGLCTDTAHIAQIKIWAHLLIVVGEGSSNLQAGVLVGVMYDDVVAVPGDIHGREEVGAVQQEGMAQAGNGASCHLEGCHCCPVVPPLHWHLCRQAEHLRHVKLVRQAE